MTYHQIKTMPEIDDNIYLSMHGDGVHFADWRFISTKKAEPFLILPLLIY